MAKLHAETGGRMSQVLKEFGFTALWEKLEVIRKRQARGEFRTPRHTRRSTRSLKTSTHNKP